MTRTEQIRFQGYLRCQQQLAELATQTAQARGDHEQAAIQFGRDLAFRDAIDRLAQIDTTTQAAA